MSATTLTGRIKAKAALVDPNRYGRSDRSALGRWFWEIDRVLLLLLAVLIGIGLIAVAAASPAVAQRYSGGSVRVADLHYFYRQILWIGLSMPVMILISMQKRERLRRLSLLGAVFCVTAIPLLVGGAAIFLMGRRYGEEPREERFHAPESVQPAQAKA